MESSMEIIRNFLHSSGFITWLVILRFIFLFLSLTMACFVVFVLWRSSWIQKHFLTDLREIVTYKPFGLKKYEKQWEKIKLRLDTGLISEFKLAIIESDSLVDSVLTKMGITGTGLSEKLEKLTPIFISNLNELKGVHIIRNSIIHDPDYRLSSDEAKKLLAVYEEVLSNLQVL